VTAPGVFKSSNTTWANVTVFGPFTHGLGFQPQHFWYTLTCTTANDGYSVGDIIYGLPNIGNSGGTASITFCLNNGGTTFSVITGASTIQVNNKSTGTSAAITVADWTLNFYAY
jgi:hypothetical protein